MKKTDLSFMYSGLKSKVIPEKPITTSPYIVDGTEIDNFDSKYDTWSWAIYRFWLNKIYDPIRYFHKEVKWFIQRGKRGYSDKDLWDYDAYLAILIRDGLRDLSKISHGHPGKYKTQKQWIKRLNTTADTFDTWINYFEMNDVPHGDKKTTTKKYWNQRNKRVEKNQEKMKAFIEDFGCYWN